MFGLLLFFAVEVREMTLRSRTVANFVRISSFIPSAKYAFAFSTLRFWNGRTAIDLSILRAEARGNRKNPAAAEIIAPTATSRIRLRRRCAPETLAVA